MTDLTDTDLRVTQPENAALQINRDWLRLLDYIAGQRVRRNASGLDVLGSPPGTAGFPSRLGGKVRKLWEHGLAVLGPESTYQLTDFGEQRRQETRAGYAAASVTAGR